MHCLSFPIEKKVRVLTLEDYYPLSYMKQDGFISGLFPALIDSIFLERGYEVEFIPINSNDTGLEMISSGEADILSSLFYSSRRALYVDFSLPYLNLETKIATLKESPQYLELDSLKKSEFNKSKIIGIQNGDYSYEYLQTFRDTFLMQATIDLESSFLLLKSKKISAVIADDYVIESTINELSMRNEVLISDEPIYEKQLHIGVNKKREDLLKIINSKIIKMTSNNSINLMKKEWLNKDFFFTGGVKISHRIFYLSLTFASLFFIFFIVLEILSRSKASKYYSLIDSLLSITPDLVIELKENGKIKNTYFRNKLFKKYYPELSKGKISARILDDILGKELGIRIRFLMLNFKNSKPDALQFEHSPKEDVYNDVRLIPFNRGVYILVITDKTKPKLIENELESKEAEYKTLIENIPGAVFRIEEEGSDLFFKFITDSIVEITGYPSTYFLGKTFHSFNDMIIPEDYERMEKLLIWTPDRRFCTSEYRIRNSNNQIVWIQERTKVYKSDNKRMFEGIYIDITEKKNLDRDLIYIETIYKNILDNTNEGIVIAKNFNIVHSNSAIRSILGVQGHSIDDVNINEFVHPAEIPALAELQVRLKMKPITIRNYNTRFITTKREVLFVELNFIPIVWYGYQAYIIFVSDQTQRKTDENVLYFMKNFLESILDNIPIGILTVDEKGKIKQINHFCEDLFNVSEKNVVGTLYFDTITDLELYNRYFYEVIEEGNIKFLESINFKSSATRFFNMRMLKLTDENEKGMIFFIEDITDLRNKENQLLQAQKMEVLGALAGGLAHDFNNALTSTIGTLSLLRYKLKSNTNISPKEIINQLDIIEKSSNSTSILVKRLLSFSRKQEIDSIPMDLNRSVEDSIKILKSSIDKSINLNVTYYKNSAKIKADPQNMEQLLINLCVNASHAMTFMRGEEDIWGGELSVVIDRFVADDKFCESNSDAYCGEYFVLRVRDTGIGMSEKIKAKIFDPFFSTKDKEKGTGLGLASVFTIVKNHKGFIRVRSRVGIGTEFSVFLPSLTNNLTDNQIKNETLARNSQNKVFNIAIYGRSGFDILNASEIMTNNNHFYEVESFDEIDKLSKSITGKIDLLIYEDGIPDKNSLGEYISYIKRNPFLNNIIVFESNVNMETKIELLKLCSGFIIKPILANELSKKIDEILLR
ncbi:MAG: transporter substrate-binding domain-containing protein [Candidatus Delongbacteria bacterium]|nr:transporter substrate-binding domain-containing protein [Candidatus Delongbacteria bacterium]